ncbi:DUF4179 domain-containing protein [Brevibacillus migulae]|uniref:DUF4179 domain-containing protein n=1 Tax=Brevibacillus migulae TaxID=1644114 RepID=UPI00106E3455|nr:DUF4179 domain-containing protein [Brevibacillus migulae]
MKDIYRLLNEVETDDMEISEIENEVEVTEVEITRAKKRLIKNIRKNKGGKAKRIIAAAIIGAAIGSTAYIGISNPAYAASIPVIGDIFRFLDNGRTGVYDLYKENANDINMAKESNGIQFKIQDAIFDGKTVSFTYEITSKRDLGEKPLISMPPLNIQGYTGGLTGSNHVEKIAEGSYIGQADYSIDGEMDRVKCMITFDSIRLIDTSNKEEIKGKWSFAFQLDAVKRKEIIVNQSVEKDGFTIKIDKIQKTPMSFVMMYSQLVPEAYRNHLVDVTVDFEVRDDVGNIYEGRQNGGQGDTSTGLMNWSMTFKKLDERATKLVVIPTIYCSANSGGVSFDEKGNETIIESKQSIKNRTFSMDEITIDVK